MHLDNSKETNRACIPIFLLSLRFFPTSSISVFEFLANETRPCWIVCTCCDTALRMRSSNRLNSSKHPHAPTWQRPMKMRPIAWKSNVSSQQKTSTNLPSCTPRALTDSVLPEGKVRSMKKLLQLMASFCESLPVPAGPKGAPPS